MIIIYYYNAKDNRLTGVVEKRWNRKRKRNKEEEQGQGEMLEVDFLNNPPL